MNFTSEKLYALGYDKVVKPFSDPIKQLGSAYRTRHVASTGICGNRLARCLVNTPGIAKRPSQNSLSRPLYWTRYMVWRCHATILPDVHLCLYMSVLFFAILRSSRLTDIGSSPQ